MGRSTFSLLLLIAALASAPAATANFVYNPSEWPPINGDVKTGLGAPACVGNPAFTSEVGFVATPDLAPVRQKTENPLISGAQACPKNQNHNVTGTCWYSCGYGTDGYPCTAKEDFRSCKNGKWALSYDDGPTALTPKLLDMLKANNLKATFCLLGSQVVRFPEETKRIHADGHDLCIHTWSHSALTTQTNEEVIAEFKWTEKAIEAVTGVRPKYIRPPMGDMDNRVRAIAAKMGYQVLYWLYDLDDFRTYQGTMTEEQVITQMNTQFTKVGQYPDGIITLAHPEKNTTGIGMAEKFIKAAAGKVNLAAVSECLGDATPYLGGNPATNPINNNNNNGNTGSTTTGKSAAHHDSVWASGLVGAVVVGGAYWASSLLF